MTLRELLDDTTASWKRERPDLDLAAMSTALRINQLMNAALKAAEALFAPHGITVGEFDVLAALRRAGAGAVLTPTTLARVAMISPAGMTNRLNRLEAAGLIVRGRDPDDRRGSLVELTPNGHVIADRAVEDLVSAENELFGALSATERQRLDRILDKLIDRLDRAPVAASPPVPAAAVQRVRSET
jgi:DNA-binding MarR family transcriptional regulator